MTLGIIYALIGASLAGGLGAIGSSIGVSKIASAGASLLSKDPSKYIRVLTLSALPSTQSLYGLLFGFIILNQTGILAGNPIALTDNQGLAFLFASMPVAVSGLFSGIYQGITGRSGIKIIAEKPDSFINAIVLTSLIESFAIFGLVLSIVIVFTGINL